ncbi:MAG TPA: MFS transporter [Actinomycetota bacterium]|nr:MFS transporter [Actinomycetota bacterium]
MTNIEQRPGRPAGDARRWWALAVLCLSLVLIALDNTVLNVALPTLVRDLHASTAQLQWIVDGYQLVFAGLLFSAGSMADRRGRKGALQMGLVLFGAGTLVSAFAGSANLLIVTRSFMGIGGALIMPATLSILGTVFPDPAERTKAIAIWAAMAAVGIAIGPVLGGVLLAHFSWGSIFLINVPVVVIALVGGGLLLPKSKDPSPGRADPVGSLLSVGTLMSLMYAVIEGPSLGWTSGDVLGSAVLGIALLLAFLSWESHSDHPMLDLRLFQDRRFSVGALSLTLLYFSALGTYFLYTQHLQFVMGYSALRAGVYTVPFAVVLVLVSLQTPRALRRYGTGRVAGTGLLVLAAALLVRATANADTTYGLLLVSLVITAVGVGCTIAPSTASIMSSLAQAQAGVGSAMNDAARQVGAAAGVAVLGSVWASSYEHALAAPRLHAAIPAAAVQASRTSVGAALAAARSLPANRAAGLVEGVKGAFVHGSNVACVVAAGVALVGAVLAVRALPRSPRERIARTADVEIQVLDLTEELL